MNSRPSPLQLAHPTQQLAIVAHDGRKPDLRLWVDRHGQRLANVAIVATSTTATAAKARNGALGTALGTPLALLQAELVAGKGVYHKPGIAQKTVTASDRRRTTGAKFVKP